LCWNDKSSRLLFCPRTGHQGALLAESTHDHGTTFTARLPLAPPREVQQHMIASANYHLKKELDDGQWPEFDM
jgi:hypothetical protein